MLDQVEINVIAGRGGNGAVSFRREKFEPRGGPDGGDGGRGGSVLVRADGRLVVLDHLRRRRVIRAQDGRPGGPRKRHGRDGEDVVIEVPPGTIVWETGGEERYLGDLAEPGRALLVARGGKGGRGNARFATSTRRVPRIAERGLPGDERRLRLELRILADVGIVGLPNAGKSSLLRAVSRARPKVGAYPFTTLEPQVGVVEHGYSTFIVAEVPGIIEGAHLGKGLGLSFLRHAERTRLIVHVVDGSGDDLRADREQVREEMRQYGGGLEEKPWLLAINKIDLPGVRERAAGWRREFEREGVKTYLVSALTGEGVDSLVEDMARLAGRPLEGGWRHEEPAVVETLEAKPEPVAVERRNGVFVVSGDGPRRAVELLGVDSEQAVAEVVRRLRRMGVAAALRRAGVRPGDRVRVGQEEIEWPG